MASSVDWTIISRIISPQSSQRTRARRYVSRASLLDHYMYQSQACLIAKIVYANEHEHLLCLQYWKKRAGGLCVFCDSVYIVSYSSCGV
jgi:hypothetical protein